MSAKTTSTEARTVLTVSQLNQQAKRLLESELLSIWVEGEISSFAQPSSGHWYFTLKDNRAQVKCAMFRNRNLRVRFRPESGQKVLIRASASLYEARGDYQLIVEGMQLSGDGALMLAFEQLKAKLNKEGLFDEGRKREIPSLPQHIALITSETGAAIHDVLTVLARRFPAIPVTIIPSLVQGDTAPARLCQAIELANRRNTDIQPAFDVILLTRGGGSLEDLWAFNDETLARTIAASRLPIVSAVGHEVDFTIADFVADARAPTPSAAAEMLSPDQREWLETFYAYENLLEAAAIRLLNNLKKELSWMSSRLKHPGSRLSDQSQRLDELELRLQQALRNQQQSLRHQLELQTRLLQRQHPEYQFDVYRQKLTKLLRQLQLSCNHHQQKKQQKLASLSQLLDAVSPLATLQRGYAVVRDEQEKVITSSRKVKPGQQLTAKLAEGTLFCTLDKIATE